MADNGRSGGARLSKTFAGDCRKSMVNRDERESPTMATWSLAICVLNSKTSLAIQDVFVGDKVIKTASGGSGCTGMKTVRCGGSDTDIRGSFRRAEPVVVVHDGKCCESTVTALTH